MDGVTLSWLLLFSLVNSGLAAERTLRSWVNPDCKEQACDFFTTVYLRANGTNDTLHYLWDFSGTPSILLAITGPNGWLNVSWPEFIERKQNSVAFTEDPSYTFGVVIKELLEFDDVNDTAMINTANLINVSELPLEHFRWVRKVLSQSAEIVGLDMEGNSYNDTTMNITRNGSVKLSLRGFCSLDHSNQMPHMLHTENSTQIDIILDNLETNSSYANSRFAVELLAVGGGNPDVIVSIDPKKSLDDEHTPGIFEVIEVKLPPYRKARDETGAYLQWRPVSYTMSSRDVSASTETIQYPPTKVADHIKAVKNTALYCYYGDSVTELLTQRIIISLGQAGDGFYKKTNYSTWTFIIGYGTPPSEQFSYLVIMIISIGLGLPLLIILGAGIYICIHRMPKRHSDHCPNR